MENVRKIIIALVETDIMVKSVNCLIVTPSWSPILQLALEMVNVLDHKTVPVWKATLAPSVKIISVLVSQLTIPMFVVVEEVVLVLILASAKQVFLETIVKLNAVPNTHVLDMVCVKMMALVSVKCLQITDFGLVSTVMFVIVILEVMNVPLCLTC